MSEQVFQIAAKALIRNPKGEILMIHVPQSEHNSAHWNLPGGRMDTSETFLDTLKRELVEEIGVAFVGEPKQLMGMLTNITIPVGNKLLPLVFMIYAVEIKNIDKIKLANDTREDELAWFSPRKAASLMAFKFSKDFCNLVRKL